MTEQAETAEVAGRSDKVAKRHVGQVLAFNRVKARCDAWDEFQRRAEAEEWLPGEAERRYEEWCTHEAKRKKAVTLALGPSGDPDKGKADTDEEAAAPAQMSSVTLGVEVVSSRAVAPTKASARSAVRDSFPRPSAAELAEACKRLDSSSDEGGPGGTPKEIMKRHNAMLREELAARRDKEAKKQQKMVEKVLLKGKSDKSKTAKKTDDKKEKKKEKKKKEKRKAKRRKKEKKAKSSSTSSSSSSSGSSS